ncbi:hypothetical protein ABL78_0041 [Leptomonas seymouri]|uniref:Uncharacterized protein n=1 Tax=Leptomonas seymouri TaxID=5684 RepID=A0A0N1PFI5_LEPSE|nr:hypothetical protein ABL78_0041 [Leptomonas seymouri]|eukprot:KPI90808.1 hypothetical protein ABL78_0041 [Leptomonas seymouri]
MHCSTMALAVATQVYRAQIYAKGFVDVGRWYGCDEGCLPFPRIFKHALEVLEMRTQHYLSVVLFDVKLWNAARRELLRVKLEKKAAAGTETTTVTAINSPVKEIRKAVNTKGTTSNSFRTVWLGATGELFAVRAS